MDTFFLICALLGGTVLVCQFAMTLLGMGDHGGDFDHAGSESFADHTHTPAGTDPAADAAHGSTWLFGVLTFRTLVAATAFFGLAGKAALAADLEMLPSVLIALAAGVAAMYGVHALMQGMTRLTSDGTVHIERAVGRPGTVYLTIPGSTGSGGTGSSGPGLGKIHLNLQNRLVEYQATSRDKLPTGAKVVVTRVVGPDTVEVEAAN